MTASTFAQQTEANSQNIGNELYELPHTIPLFNRYEIKYGAILGSGAFCTVCIVDTIIAQNQITRRYDKRSSKESIIRQEKRQSLIQQFQENRFHQKNGTDGSDPQRKPPPRYAIKYLKRGLSSNDRQRGIQDLEIELHLLLKCIGHPNIISVAGVGGDAMVNLTQDGKSSSNHKDRFLILDRLQSTLQKRFYKWREMRGIGIFEVLSINERENKDLWLKRMVILNKIASALNFLHRRSMIYRDLKPENIGFDFDDTPKLFDFGLARTLPTITKDSNVNNDIDKSFYKMTGMTGSPRYMAPEIATSQPYGINADVYSFAILMHEVLSLKVPYAGISGIKKLQHNVVNQNVRPQIDSIWPESISNLLIDMWNGNHKQRLNSNEVVKRLESLLRGSDTDLFPAWGVKRWVKDSKNNKGFSFLQIFE